jgi:hypothetical protein
MIEKENPSSLREMGPIMYLRDEKSGFGPLRVCFLH